MHITTPQEFPGSDCKPDNLNKIRTNQAEQRESMDRKDIAGTSGMMTPVVSQGPAVRRVLNSQRSERIKLPAGNKK